MSEIISKESYAKVNIFLKMAGKRDDYHKLVSRFVRVRNLYDVVEFQKGKFESFTLEGNFGCATQQNTIYKAYVELYKLFKNVEDYFKIHKVLVRKTIPEFAGLGGGSSNCATFMIMVNEVCKLGLTKNELATIGAKIGADVPFFIYEYDSANVTGIGEVVEKFDEDILNIEVVTPDIKCDTGDIFREFRKNFYKEISSSEAKVLMDMKSIDILEKLDIKKANDLYLPALACNPQLETTKSDYYFSGSGSSFFCVKK